MALAIHPALVEMRGRRAELTTLFQEGQLDGPGFHRELSEAMDAAIRTVWRSLAIPVEGVSLIAVGGYGRGLLAPGSDVDLLILHSGVAAAGSQGQGLFYALWDAGLKVGHAVRTIKESLSIASDSLEAETSFLDMRLLDGDQQLFEKFSVATRKQTEGRRDRFVDDVHQMMLARHAAHGSATSQLEPNIKDGTGGLRDLHVLDWFSSAAGDLVELRLLDKEDQAELDRAHDLLLTARAHLHLMTGGANDVLPFHLQRPLAQSLGFVDGDMFAEDALMRELFKVTRVIELTVESVSADLLNRDAKPKRSAPRSGPFVVAGVAVLLDGELDLEQRPEDALALFSFGVTPGAAAMRAARRALGKATLTITPAVRTAFIALLANAPGRLLEMADHAGVFAALFPEWDSVRLQPQRNVYHRYTVDAHLFHTAEAMAAMLASSDDPIVQRVVADLTPSEREVLLMAGLFHDIGKGGEEDHSVRGERMARAIAARLSLDHQETEELAWLVREHLMLVLIATQRDLSDPVLLEDVARRIGTQERARLLFLLTVADGVGTGPAAWTPWKADLVTELFTKIIHVLERGALASSDLANEARERVREAERLAGRDSEIVAAHLQTMSRAYVLRFPPETLVRHAILARDLAKREVRTLHSDLEDGTSELTVVTHDEPGLFRRVSGVLALHSLSIVASEVHTDIGGVALEWFRCVGPRGLTIEEDRWRRVDKDLQDGLRGRLALDARLAKKRAEENRRSLGKQEPPRVLTDLDASEDMTVVEVHAADRLGLLHDITAALQECGVDVHRAKIATYGDDIVDVFYVRNLDGEKITDRGHLAEIERAILHRLST